MKHIHKNPYPSEVLEAIRATVPKEKKVGSVVLAIDLRNTNLRITGKIAAGCDLTIGLDDPVILNRVEGLILRNPFATMQNGEDGKPRKIVWTIGKQPDY